MKNRRAGLACAWAVIGTLAAAAPAVSRAEAPQDDWHFTATIYGWLPSLGGDISFPTGPGGGGGGSSSASVDASKILDALNFVFMGAFEAQKGRWGLATDVIYLDLSASDKKTRNFTVGGVDLPANVTAKVDLGITGWLWTVDGTYLAVEDPDHPVELLAGARLLNLSPDLQWHLDGDISGLPLPGRDGRSEVSSNLWDGIVGLKGRVKLGADKKWFIPYYVDVGTGDSDLTWQGIIGVGYSFGWGDLFAAWRYLDYNMPSGEAIDTLWMNGAAIGASFRF